ncbi:MAG: flagellar motor protein MotB [Deltaproteobacteria bacterium]|nr:flagellar motor protein MotB [Deltaproteobacteria bacterium]
MSNGDRKRPAEEGQGGTPSWMVTFSDLSTLLLTFFVLLLSMSTLDDLTLKSLFHNFTSSNGILYFKEYGEIYKPKEVLIETLYEKLKDNLVVKRSEDPPDDLISPTKEQSFEEIGSSLIVEDVKNGFKLVFGHKLLFSSGSAEIREDMKDMLDRVARFMRASSYQIYIDGHTDSVPIHTPPYGSNEELSLARAYNLLRYFVKEANISHVYLAMGGYGDCRPADTNETASGREKNRRVEMIFKNKRYF